ncbi:MAG TPA: hypothetical protein VN325_40690 [Steroidobacteraceae bacterium]|nr:hypothetical protein [Steroidobacteraceae bacterium]
MPSRARLLAEYFAAIVVDATANLDDEPSVRCRRRPGRRRCTGTVMSYPGADDQDRIYGYCPTCNDNGFISGWQRESGTFRTVAQRKRHNPERGNESARTDLSSVLRV